MKNLIKRMAFLWLFPDGVFIEEDLCSQKLSHTIRVLRSDKTGWLKDAIHKGIKIDLDRTLT